MGVGVTEVGDGCIVDEGIIEDDVGVVLITIGVVETREVVGIDEEGTGIVVRQLFG